MMKTILATAITVAALVLGTGTLSPGVAQAKTGDVFDMDKYEAEVKAHGWVEGEDYIDPNQLDVLGLIDCNGVAEHGGSRDAWVNSFKNVKMLPPSKVAVTTDAAIDAFCPQYRH
jgi:hypothetical protein